MSSSEKSIKQQPIKRMGEFDVWKLVFAVVIVVHHTYLLPTDIPEIPLFQGGSIGVEFFFLVSGFLLARSASKTDLDPNLGHQTACFIVKKIKSFFPYMVFAFAVTFVFKALSLDWGGVATGKNLFNSIVELSFARMSGMGDAFFNVPTWYLSTMVLSMMVLYPLILKYRGAMTKVVFPVVAICILGYLFQKYGQLRTPDAWDGLLYKGTLRGFAEIMLGAFAFELCEWFKKYKFTFASRLLLTAFEYGVLLFIIVYSNEASCWDLDCPSILLMVLCVVIMGANASVFASVLGRSKFVSLCGKFSLMLYLNHLYWIYIFDVMGLHMGYYEMTALLVVASIASSIVCWLVTDAVVKFLKLDAVKALFVSK